MPPDRQLADSVCSAFSLRAARKEATIRHAAINVNIDLRGAGASVYIMIVPLQHRCSHFSYLGQDGVSYVVSQKDGRVFAAQSLAAFPGVTGIGFE